MYTINPNTWEKIAVDKNCLSNCDLQENRGSHMQCCVREVFSALSAGLHKIVRTSILHICTASEVK